MESLMRFGRDGCMAVLQDFEEWVRRKGGKTSVDGNRDQIAYARDAKQLWFGSQTKRNILLQDVWTNRIRNRDPARGCLRKVISMLYITNNNQIRLKRKHKWFCEARRHAGTYSNVPSSFQTNFGFKDDEREVGDRNEIVLFSTSNDQQEVDEVFEQHYEAASQFFPNGRTKDQASVLVAYLQKIGFYPIRAIHAADWVTRRKRAKKFNESKRQINKSVYKRPRDDTAGESWSSTENASKLLTLLSKRPRLTQFCSSHSKSKSNATSLQDFLLQANVKRKPHPFPRANSFGPGSICASVAQPNLNSNAKFSQDFRVGHGAETHVGRIHPLNSLQRLNSIGIMQKRSDLEMQLYLQQLEHQLQRERLQQEYKNLLEMQRKIQYEQSLIQQRNSHYLQRSPPNTTLRLQSEISTPEYLVSSSLPMPPLRIFPSNLCKSTERPIFKNLISNRTASIDTN